MQGLLKCAGLPGHRSVQTSRKTQGQDVPWTETGPSGHFPNLFRDFMNRGSRSRAMAGLQHILKNRMGGLLRTLTFNPFHLQQDNLAAPRRHPFNPAAHSQRGSTAAPRRHPFNAAAHSQQGSTAAPRRHRFSLTAHSRQGSTAALLQRLISSRVSLLQDNLAGRRLHQVSNAKPLRAAGIHQTTYGLPDCLIILSGLKAGQFLNSGLKSRKALSDRHLRQSRKPYSARMPARLRCSFSTVF